jgi:hypothetical protein
MSEIRLADLLRRGEAAREDAERLASGLLASELAWTPGPGRWGIAQCLDHLARTATSYRPGIERALDAAPRGSGDLIRPGFLPARILHAIGPRGALRLPAPGRFRPPAEPRPGALPRFVEAHEAFLGHLRAGASRDLDAVRLASPVSPLLRLTLGEILALLTGHAERHLAQAWRVRRDAAFPRRP